MSTVFYHKEGTVFGAEGSDAIVVTAMKMFNPDAMRMEIVISDGEHIEKVNPHMLQHDVVAIYDNAGIPSFMHRFRQTTNKDLFGGADKIHPAFVIGDETYDEIYISVYQNTMINGKPYSLPFAKPAGDITQEEFAEACFSKGEGWHCMTAAEWGLLADISLKLGTIPHGNTRCGSWHGDDKEKGTRIENSFQVLTGSGPETWTHNHKKTGVFDLCGNGYEFCRGARIKDGMLQAAKNNDAALPETDLSESGKDWVPVVDNEGKPIFVSVGDEGIAFITEGDIEEGCSGSDWGSVEIDCESEQLKELALFPGDRKNFFCADSGEGEFILFRGGGWDGGEGDGVFYAYLYYDRSFSYDYIGGRSAYFLKRCAPDTETLTDER